MLWNILQHVDTQWRVAAAGGPFGLDYNVVDTRALAAGIPLNEAYYAKVKAYETAALDILNNREGKETCDEKKKAACRVLYGDTLEWTCKNCKEING
jgi:hypothetical protein